MELYIVYERDETDFTSYTVGIFDSKEKAQKAADWLNQNIDDIFVSYDVCGIPSELNKIDKDVLERYNLSEEEAQA